MIELKHVSKTFDSDSGGVDALKDVSLTIEDGDIYGIIGMSGAGKSTLVRCINLLEKPTAGASSRPTSSTRRYGARKASAMCGRYRYISTTSAAR